MQTISRRVNQGIVIGTEYQLTVVGIGENWVDLEIQSSDGGDAVRRKTFRVPVTTAPVAGHGEKQNSERQNTVAAAISVSRV